MRTEDQESALLKKLDGEIGFGCFHVLILILGCIIALCLTFGIISISLVMPVNERDLELNSSRKGGIESCLFMGMLVGSVLFGWLSDSCGRRVALLWALPLTSASLLFSAFSFHWAFFLVMVFCIGVGTGGSIVTLITYVAECSAERLRGPLLIVVQSCQDLSMACATLLAWVLMGSNGEVSQMSVQLGSLRFVAWRLYLVLCASIVLLVVPAILCAPESPLFLLHRKQDKRLQLLLDRMQRLNSCGHTKCYLSGGKANAVKKSLSNTELLTDGSQTSDRLQTSDSLQTSHGLQTSDSPQTYNGLNSMALCEQGLGPRSQKGVDTQVGMHQAAGRDGESSHKDKDPRNEKQEQADGQEGPSMWQKEEDVVMEHFFRHNCGRVMLDLIHKLIKQVSTFYCSSHTYKTIILHVIFFTTLFGYYGAKLWFPEIFKRILIYKDAHPFQIKHHSKYQNQSGLQEPYVYYQDALFITLSTIPSNIIAAVMFKVLGAKILLVGSGLITSVGGIAMWFVPMEHGAVLALCCVYNAGISLAQSALKIGATNLYPTAIRSTALGLHSAVGRLGAIAANIVFGELVDTSLALPMLLSAGMVLLGTGVGLFIPRMYSKQDKPMLYRCASKAVLCCKAG